MCICTKNRCQNYLKEVFVVLMKILFINKYEMY